MKTVSFKMYEDIAVGIPNPKVYLRLKGPPEFLERIVAAAVEEGLEVYDIKEESDHDH